MIVFRNWLIALLVWGLACTPFALGQVVSRHTIPWTCEQVREAYRTLTHVEIEWIAKRYRLTKEQRQAALACLKERK